MSPSNGEQAVPEAAAEVEDKDTVKNEEPSEHVANGKGISLFWSFLIKSGPVVLHPLPASRLCISLKQKKELFGSDNLISCSDCS